MDFVVPIIAAPGLRGSRILRRGPGPSGSAGRRNTRVTCQRGVRAGLLTVMMLRRDHVEDDREQHSDQRNPRERAAARVLENLDLPDPRREFLGGATEDGKAPANEDR